MSKQAWNRWVFEAFGLLFLGFAFVTILAAFSNCSKRPRQIARAGVLQDRVIQEPVPTHRLPTQGPKIVKIKYYELVHAGQRLPIGLLEVHLDRVGGLAIETLNKDGTSCKAFDSQVKSNMYQLVFFNDLSSHWQNYRLEDAVAPKGWFEWLKIEAYDQETHAKTTFRYPPK